MGIQGMGFGVEGFGGVVSSGPWYRAWGYFGLRATV